jgi:hypothetical protein
MHRMRRVAEAVAVALLSALTVVACQSKESGAREFVAERLACPVASVEVRPRSDLSPRDVGAAAHCDVWEARGCGHQTRLCCFRTKQRPDRVHCATVDYPPGATKF